MGNIVDRMFKANGLLPPDPCIEGLSHNFEDALNVEWGEKENGFEALFHKDQSEYIALFNKDGVLLEYKQFLPQSYLPEPIKIYLESRGEIMNIVMRNKGNRIEFEAIIRDRDQARHLLLLSESGHLIEQRIL